MLRLPWLRGPASPSGGRGCGGGERGGGRRGRGRGVRQQLAVQAQIIHQPIRHAYANASLLITRVRRSSLHGSLAVGAIPERDDFDNLGPDSEYEDMQKISVKTSDISYKVTWHINLCAALDLKRTRTMPSFIGCRR